MDSLLPEGMVAALQHKRGPAAVALGDRRHPLVEITERGFVIEADGRPPLRGFVDILRGGAMVARRLVVCAWARDGRVGYEFKQGGGIGPGGTTTAR